MFAPIVFDVRGPVSGTDGTGRLLWSGEPRSFAHSPKPLNRGVLILQYGFRHRLDDHGFAK